MNKFWISVVALLLTSEPAAQSAPPPVPPAGNLLDRAPEFARWTIECRPLAGSRPVVGPKAAPPESRKEKKKPGAANGDQLPGAPSPGSVVEPTVRTTVTKTVSIFHLQSVGTGGNAEEKWCRPDLQATLRPGLPDPLISVPGNRREVGYVDFSRSDFPDCVWVGRDNYVGLEQRDDRPCLVFSSQILLQPADETPGQDEPQRVVVTAYVDYYSRLPVALIWGDTVRTYRYEMPPQQPQVIPDPVAEAMRRHEQKIRELSLKPAKPF